MRRSVLFSTPPMLNAGKMRPQRANTVCPYWWATKWARCFKECSGELYSDNPIKYNGVLKIYVNASVKKCKLERFDKNQN